MDMDNHLYFRVREQSSREALLLKLDSLDKWLDQGELGGRGATKRLSLRRLFRSRTLTSRKSERALRCLTSSPLSKSSSPACADPRLSRSFSVSTLSWPECRPCTSHQNLFVKLENRHKGECEDSKMRPGAPAPPVQCCSLKLVCDKPPKAPAKVSSSSVRQSDWAAVKQDDRHRKEQRGFARGSLVLHQECSLVTSTRVPDVDVMLVYSAKCPVSLRCLANVQKIIASSSYIKDLCDDQPRVMEQRLEAFSDLLLSSSGVSSKKKADYLGELVTHAKVQVVLLSQSFLDWVKHHPDIVLKQLFYSGSKVIGLLLDIKELTDGQRAELFTPSDRLCLLPVFSQADLHEADLHDAIVNVLQKRSCRAPVQPNCDQLPANPLQQKKETQGFKIWPRTVSMRTCNWQSQILLLLDTAIQASDQCEVTVAAVADPTQKLSAYCKILTATNLEVTFALSDNLGFGSSKLELSLSVNGVPWICSDIHEAGTFELEMKPDLHNQLDQLLENMVNSCLPKNIFMQEQKVWRSARGGEEAVDQEEHPSLLHWTAFHGLQKTSRALMQFPNAAQAATLPNHCGLTASDMAQKNCHFEVAHLLRKEASAALSTSPHKYEYPVLPVRPCSDSSLVNRGGRNVAGQYECPVMPARRVSDGQLMSLYDVPRAPASSLPTQSLYDIPPKPVKVEDFMLSSMLSGANHSPYLTMQPRTRSESSHSTSPMSREQLLQSLRRNNRIQRHTREPNSSFNNEDAKPCIGDFMSVFSPFAFTDYKPCYERSSSMYNLQPDSSQMYEQVKVKTMPSMIKDSSSPNFGTMLKKSLITMSDTLKRKKKNSESGVQDDQDRRLSQNFHLPKKEAKQGGSVKNCNHGAYENVAVIPMNSTYSVSDCNRIKPL